MRLQQNDLSILRELFGWTGGNFPKGSLNLTARDISARTGLHRNTVQRRLAAMRDGGALLGFLYEPRPSWLHLVRSGQDFLAPRIRDIEELRRILAPFPAVSIAALHAGSCFLHTWHVDEGAVAGDTAALKDALGAEAVRTSYVSSAWPHHPSDDIEVTPLDRRLLLGLRRGFDRSVSAVAEQVGVNRRTAARRIARLVEGECGALLPMLQPQAVDGTLFVVYDTDERSEVARAGLAASFPDRIMGPTGSGTNPMVLVPCANVDEATTRHAEAARRPGLEGLRASFLRGWYFPEASDLWLRAHVQNAPPRVADR